MAIPRTMMRAIRFPFWLLPSLVPPAVLVLWMKHYSVPVIYMDMWGLVPYMEDILLHHDIDPSLFLFRINEHIITFPLIFIVMTAKLTGWNLFAEILLTPMAAGVSAVMLGILLYRCIAHWHAFEKSVIFLCFSTVIFSL